MNIWCRAKNLWFLSGLSKEDIKANPHSFMQRYVNAQEMNQTSYIAGLSEEESSYAASLNANGKDTYII